MKGKTPNTHELIRLEAYLLSEKAGHPSHMDDYFWTQAEAIVRQRAAIVKVAVKASAKKPGKSAKTQPKIAAKPTAAVKKPAPKAAKKEPTPLPPVEKHVAAKPVVAPAKPKAIAPKAKKPAAKAPVKKEKPAPKSK